MISFQTYLLQKQHRLILYFSKNPNYSTYLRKYVGIKINLIVVSNYNLREKKGSIFITDKHSRRAGFFDLSRVELTWEKIRLTTHLPRAANSQKSLIIVHTTALLYVFYLFMTFPPSPQVPGQVRRCISYLVVIRAQR